MKRQKIDWKDQNILEFNANKYILLTNEFCYLPIKQILTSGNTNLLISIRKNLSPPQIYVDLYSYITMLRFSQTSENRISHLNDYAVFSKQQ